MTGVFVCVGDLDVDLMVSVARMPGVDDKVSGRRICQSVGGMAANVAVGLCRLGSSARLVAAVGGDQQGVVATEAVSNEGVDTRFLVRRPDEATFTCVVLLGPDGEKSLIRLETGAYLPDSPDVSADAFEDARHVHLTLGRESLTRHCVGHARAAEATLSLDLEAADLPESPDRIVDILAEVDWLFLTQRTREFLEGRVGKAVFKNSRCVITTNGASGCVLDRGGCLTRAKGHAVKAQDTTGAGDAFVAAFLHAHLVDGLPEKAALGWANAAAALVVQQFGAQSGLPTSAEIERFLERGQVEKRVAAQIGPNA